VLDEWLRRQGEAVTFQSALVAVSGSAQIISGIWATMTTTPLWAARAPGVQQGCSEPVEAVEGMVSAVGYASAW